MRCHAEPKRPAPPAAATQLARPGRAGAEARPALGAEGGSTGAGRLPSRIRASAEALSGFSLADVRVHTNSPEPAKLGALAFARGTDIHLGPRQEQHLPHEAWHVVQQKQGRVGGAGLNADPALEAEADRMGDRAARGGIEGKGPPRPATAKPGVVQAKVIDGEQELSPKDPVSPTLLSFIKKKNRYRLRDDFHENRMAEPVHLLDMSRKYLLGETHGPAATAKWNEATKFWSKVGKMFEWTKALPGSERRKVGMPADDKQDQPLESRHAWTLTEVLRTHNVLNVVGASWVRSLWTDPAHKDQIRSLLVEAADDLFSADFGHREYGAFAAAYEGKGRHSKRSKQVYAFAKDFRDVYHPAFGVLADFLKTATNTIDIYDPKAADADSVKAQFETALDGIAASRGFLVTMATSLMSLTGARGEERQRLNESLAPTDSRQDMLTPVDPARERAMAENVTAAEAPLFVKIGDDHVDDVAKLVGPSAVAIHETGKLEDVTRQPPGP